jgi:hypothetical protein
MTIAETKIRTGAKSAGTTGSIWTGPPSPNPHPIMEMTAAPPTTTIMRLEFATDLRRAVKLKDDDVM